MPPRHWKRWMSVRHSVSFSWWDVKNAKFGANIHLDSEINWISWLSKVTVSSENTFFVPFCSSRTATRLLSVGWYFEFTGLCHPNLWFLTWEIVTGGFCNSSHPKIGRRNIFHQTKNKPKCRPELGLDSTSAIYMFILLFSTARLMDRRELKFTFTFTDNINHSSR